MPHIIVKMLPGRSDALKQSLADAITAAVKSTLDAPESAISVGIEDVERSDWNDAVVKPDIIDRKETMFRMPGYPIGDAKTD